MEMNKSPIYGIDWIQNIANIGETQYYKLYPSGGASLMSGRFYIALPSTTVLTYAIKQQYNLW